MTDTLTLVGEGRLRELLKVEALLKSLLSEDGVRETFLSYNVGAQIIDILEAKNE